MNTSDIPLEVNQRWRSIQSRGVAMVLVASCCINQNKLRLHGSGRLEVQNHHPTRLLWCTYKIVLYFLVYKWNPDLFKWVYWCGLVIMLYKLVRSNFRVRVWNPKVWPLYWKLLRNYPGVLLFLCCTRWLYLHFWRWSLGDLGLTRPGIVLK